MGTIVQYITSEDRNILLKIAEPALPLESYLNENKSEIISFGTFVKSWNPLYFLLKKTSNLEVFEILADNFSHETYDEYKKIISSQDVKTLHQYLNKMSLSKIQELLDDIKLCEVISKQPGYNMDYIYDQESILVEFKALKEAAQSAYSLNAGLVQILYP